MVKYAYGSGQKKIHALITLDVIFNTIFREREGSIESKFVQMRDSNSFTDNNVIAGKYYRDQPRKTIKCAYDITYLITE